MIGFISRYHPIKGFEEYIKFANKLNSLKKNLYFVVAGRGYADNHFVNTILKKYNIPNILFVGNIKNISNFYPALDCIFLTSKSESFPNVIPEAMLSEVFCVSNNVELFLIVKKKIMGIMWHPERFERIRRFEKKIFKDFF